MDTVVVTIQAEKDTVDLSLPTSVPFAQLAQILIDTISWNSPPVLTTGHAWAGRLHTSGLIIRPQETLADKGIVDGNILSLISIPKSDIVTTAEPRQPGYGTYLQSLETGDVFPIRGRRVIIGRSGHHLVNLSQLPKGDVVSRNHAHITHRHNKFWLQDENSLNGTFVDGYLLQPGESVHIRDNCQIQFGQDGPLLLFRTS